MKNNASNKLQTFLLQCVEKINCIVVENPEDIIQHVTEFLALGNRTFNRCSPMKLHVNRDYKDKTLVNGLSIDGLFQLSVHKILGKFSPKMSNSSRPVLEKMEGSTQPETTPATPIKSDLPEPAPAHASDENPRIAIQKSRENDTPVDFKKWFDFSPSVQSHLLAGKVWAIYHDQNGLIIAELYGGQTHPAFT